MLRLYKRNINFNDRKFFLGGTYLEAFKHIHRDLAARNCLISSKTNPQRVTKIGI